MNTLGERIRKRRRELRLRQSDLAEAIGVKPNTISQWEKGRTHPRPERISQVAEALKVDPGFFDVAPDPTPRSKLLEGQAEILEVLHFLKSGMTLFTVPEMSLDYWHEDLRAARLSKGLRQADVARELGTAAQAVSAWERGRHKPSEEYREKLRQLYQDDLASLDQPPRRQGGSHEQWVEAVEQFKETMTDWMDYERKRRTTVAVYASVAAGIGGGVSSIQILEGKTVETIELEEWVLQADPNTFAIRVAGNATVPSILDGDILICSPGSAKLEDGDIAIVLTRGGESVKRVRRREGKLVLESDDPEYKGTSDDEEIQRVVKVIALQRRF